LEAFQPDGRKGHTETEELTDGTEFSQAFQPDGLRGDTETDESTVCSAESAEQLTENAGEPRSQNDPETQPDPSQASCDVRLATTTPANAQNDPEPSEVRRKTRLMARDP
jgi:hypothetical protein